MKLGEHQKHFLTSSLENGPWPASGWMWTNHSSGLRLAQSLERKGLLEPRLVPATKWSGRYTSYDLTAKGREIAKTFLSPRRLEAVEKKEAWRKPRNNEATSTATEKA